MKVFLITTLALSLFAGCTQEQCIPFSTNKVIIYGKEQSLFLNERKLSRNTSTIKDGTEISFFSKKGIQAEDIKLTLKGNFWTTNTPIRWGDSSQNALVTAYCTSVHTNSEEYYLADGNLKDILICQKEYPYQSPIELLFRHLFAKIEFQIESNLNADIKEVRVRPSIAIKDIEPYSASITLMPSQLAHTVCLTQKADGIYTILVPPSDSFSLDIELETTAGTILSKKLTQLTCKGGYCYHSNIKEKDNHIGIYSAEDFIAFTYLVNKHPYKDRQLSEFGETHNGITTYYLKRDITFSEEQKNKFKQIGLFKNKFANCKSFNDVFDGQNHTLSNLWIQASEGDASALFQYVGKKGVVKNLIINHSTVHYIPTITTHACLCALNEGSIYNCHILNTLLTSSRDIISGMTNCNRGKMYNCSLKNITLDLSSLKNTSLEFGGLTGVNDTGGVLLNSYIDNLTLTSKINPELKISAVAFYNLGTISNCYSDHCDPQIQVLCWNNNNITNYCYYQKGRYDKHMIGKIKPDEFKRCHIIAFEETEESKQGLCNSLNNWINQTGKKKYQNCTFLPWKKNKDLTVTFDSL